MKRGRLRPTNKRKGRRRASCSRKDNPRNRGSSNYGTGDQSVICIHFTRNFSLSHSTSVNVCVVFFFLTMHGSYRDFFFLSDDFVYRGRVDLHHEQLNQILDANISEAWKYLLSFFVDQIMFLIFYRNVFLIMLI